MPPWLEPRTAYLHVPFCAHHCGYCDFIVVTGRDHLAEHYIDALALEMGEPRAVETLFIGGGTPTHLTAAQLDRLLGEINRRLPHPEGAEFSIESTPDSLDAEKVALLVARGVSRVSLGVQSFHPQVLASLDRRHVQGQIAPTIELVRRRRLALSLDLIFAAPGSTQESWRQDLDAALAFEPDHISTYGLTYEKGTPLWKERRGGRVTPIGEEEELAMYELAIDTLTAAGFEHYEVSNFARPGMRCRHNERYWANEAYHGFGVGATRYVGGDRIVNTHDTTAYIRKLLAGESPAIQTEKLEPLARAFETIATQLRRADGIDRARFLEQTGFDLDHLVGERLAGLVEQGLVTDRGAVVRLTRRGLFVADAIIAELMKSQDDS